jgi:hypothetical protein
MRCALSPRPIYALACSGTGYTCRKFDCAVGEVEDTSRTCTLYDYICCKKVPTSTPVPQPTKTPTPKPTNTPASQNCNWIGYTCVGSCAAGYSCKAVGSYTCACVANTQPTPTTSYASPTVTPQPTTGGMQCSTTAQCHNAYCVPNNTPIPNCSSVCINGHCYTTHPGINPTITDVSCRSSNDYGPWSGCMSGQNACGGCASQGYTCQVRHCIHPPNSNQYQISCGCGQPTGGGGSGNPTNTPAPIPNPPSVCDPLSPKKT